MTGMKVAILQCDNLMEKLRPRFGEYRDMIERMLSGLPLSFSFEVFDCRKQEYPSDLGKYDFFITTGSRASVYENEPWILDLIAFVRELDKNRKKLIGICFGHQLIAVALGGEVKKSDKGWGVGVSVNRVVSRPEWMNDWIGELKVLVSHQDQVTRLSEGAVVIAESDFCPYFVVQWNDHFLSIQGHPEWSRDYAEALMLERRAIIPAPRVEEGLASLRLETDHHLFVRWIVDFVSRA